MEDDLRHMQQALKASEQQLSCLAKGVKDLRIEEEANYEQKEDKFQLVLKSLSYELKVWWDCKCENRRRMGAQPIKTRSLMKQSLRKKFGVENLERQRQGQAKETFMESLMGEM
ncbi:hypothetical protein M9H77_30640 [Catharanthus roseus]|uniref:Uncharacterized protein n=1 Tax=Catharanthus roseus TaxID=4058 RepID=A0ACC0A241_CATRO|nr:hypothetical protein M9H77_30640 [Catharanthus roseus]